MLKFFVTAAAALLLTVSGPAWAQVPAAAGAASAPKAESAEAQAAMERAQRLAANPMRVILQASKFKRKAPEPDPTPDAADPANLRRTAVRTGPATSPGTEPAAVSTAALAAAASNSAKLPAVLPAQVTAQVTAQVMSQVTAPALEAPQPKFMPASLLAGSAKSSVPAMDIGLPEEAAPVMSKALAPQTLPITPAAVRPTLVTMVEPEIPVRLMGDSGRVNEVQADLSLRADGTVAEVALLSPVPRSWKTYIVAALGKWRFEPMGAARVHRIQLVFDDNK